jgi:cytochrome c5
LEDRQFTTYFLAVLALLTAFTLIILIIANSLYSSDSLKADSRVQLAVAERIKPVGEVYVGSVPADVSSSMATGETVAVAAADLSGEDVYQQVCAACHTSGVLNAPKPGDVAAWEPRLAKGVEALYASAINGIGAMPAKGGRADMSDEAIQAAVDYLIQ